MTTNEEVFAKRLKNSKPAVQFIAKWLQSQGYEPEISPAEAVPKNEISNHKDPGDILVKARIEGKGLSTKFTSAQDWKHDDFIVCAKHAWDNAKPKPLMFMYPNPARTHMAIVPGALRPLWTTRWVTDSSYNPPRSQLCYVIKTNLVSFTIVQGSL